MKLLKKAFITTFVILTSVITTSTYTKTLAQENDKNLKAVLSIDAGRKYFSENQIKEIIDKAYKNGYTDIQLILGNDGLRFFLDDMSLNVNGKKYLSDDVKKSLIAGNNEYFNDPNGNALTQKEMDRILNYAKQRNIGIIPVINSPGHMDSILVAMEKLGMKDVRYSKDGKVSKRTLNIENKEAIDFTKALIKKYVDYFAKSGVAIFNFGADEYANDVFSNPGWGELQKLGLYGEFIDYVNDLAKIIKDSGMSPMSFNDGIYYNSDDSFGTFDKDIIISYWTSGWNGFNVAKPEYFIEKGHKILNTNDGWYWVLGTLTSDQGIYDYESSIKNISEKSFNELPGGSKVETIGSMQAIWCDHPSREYDSNRIFELMDKFSSKHSEFMPRPDESTKNTKRKRLYVINE